MKTIDKKNLDKILNDFISECCIAFGKKLYDVRLFGSYARGDYQDYSDIDLMVILYENDYEDKKSCNEVCRIASMLDLKYNVTISPVIYEKEVYNTQKVFGFCKNVDIEGVSLYAN